MRALRKIAAGGVALVVLAVLAFAGLSLTAAPAPKHPYFRDNHDVVIIAHRGGAGLWPENTMHAFDGADRLGVDILEMDTHRSSDGVFMVIHDHTVDRTTDGSGAVASLTLAQLQSLDAGYRWTEDSGKTQPHRGRGLTIPTLEAVLSRFERRLLIEIKEDSGEAGARLCALLRKTGRDRDTLVCSEFQEPIAVLRERCPQVATITSAREAKLFAALSLAHLASAFHTPAEAFAGPETMGSIPVVNDRLVRFAHAHNIFVIMFDIDTTADMERLAARGADAMLSDHPDRLLRALGRLEDRVPAPPK